MRPRVGVFRDAILELLDNELATNFTGKVGFDVCVEEHIACGT